MKRPANTNPVVARAPARLSLGGGGTDLPTYFQHHGGFVLSFAIDRFSYVLVEPRLDGETWVRSTAYRTRARITDAASAMTSKSVRLPAAATVWAHRKGFIPCGRGVDLTLTSDVRPGTGLGSSSSMAVALVTALSAFGGYSAQPSEIAAWACDLEIDQLGFPIGYQDQYASAFGGINTLTFAETTSVVPINLDPNIGQDLENRMLLFALGDTRESCGILSRQSAESRCNPRVIATLHRLKRIAAHMVEALERGELDSVGVLLDESWTFKRSLSPTVSSRRIDRLYAMAKKAGAIGGKVTGAGGGGHLMLLAEAGAQEQIAASLHPEGLAHVPFRICRSGAAVILPPETVVSRGTAAVSLTKQPRPVLPTSSELAVQVQR
jgi:D-glycero-alpha-D-manno-heptose-7-phosphate kinase